MLFACLHELTEKDQIVLVRADLNVPIHEGEITDLARIQSLVPTIEYLKSLHSRIVIISHLGRPKGPFKQYSLEKLQPVLADIFKAPVQFVNDCIGQKVGQAILKMPYESILLLENLRFYEGEETNNLNFAKQLAEYGQCYVNDAFSCCHRAHASIVGITKFLPSYAGKSLETELLFLEKALTKPKNPLIAIVGGAKISTKLTLLENLANYVDVLIIGGAMANTFQIAKGYDVGNSLVESNMVSIAQNILEKFGNKIVLPTDVVIKNNNLCVDINEVPPEGDIYDIGPKTRELFCQTIEQAQTVIWNGPLGVFEEAPFEQGTKHVASFVAKQTALNKLTSIAGGGDTASALKMVGVFDQFSFVSTAGGAFLEWLEGKPLPGVEALEKKNLKISHTVS